MRSLLVFVDIADTVLEKQSLNFHSRVEASVLVGPSHGTGLELHMGDFSFPSPSIIHPKRSFTSLSVLFALMLV